MFYAYLILFILFEITISEENKIKSNCTFDENNSCDWRGSDSLLVIRSSNASSKSDYELEINLEKKYKLVSTVSFESLADGSCFHLDYHKPKKDLNKVKIVLNGFEINSNKNKQREEIFKKSLNLGRFHSYRLFFNIPENIKFKIEIELSLDRFISKRESLNVYLDNLIFDGTKKCSDAVNTKNLEKIIADFTNQTRVYSSDVDLVISNSETQPYYFENTTDVLNTTNEFNHFTKEYNNSTYFKFKTTFSQEADNKTDYYPVEFSHDFINKTLNKYKLSNNSIKLATNVSIKFLNQSPNYLNLKNSTNVHEYTLSNETQSNYVTLNLVKQDSNNYQKFSSTRMISNRLTNLPTLPKILFISKSINTSLNHTYESVINSPVPLTIYDIISFSNANFLILVVLFSLSFVILIILLFKVAVIQFRYETLGEQETHNNKDIEYLSNSNETIVTGVRYFSEENLIVDYNRNELFRAFRQFRLNSDGNAFFKNTIGVYNIEDESIENTYL